MQLLTAAVGSKLEPVLELTDPDGRVVAESANGLLGYTCPAAGTYAVGVRDREYRGDATMFYRLHVGDIPIVTGVFPLGVQRGTEADIQSRASISARRAPSMSRRRPTRPGEPAARTVGDAERPAARRLVGGGRRVSGGHIADGRRRAAHAGHGQRPHRPAGGDEHVPFPGEEGPDADPGGQRPPLGSPLDSIIEILDAKGQPLPRAVLRCLSKTVRHLPRSRLGRPGIRIETWNELAINDYLLVGGELMRINELPKNPDDDCQFFVREAASGSATSARRRRTTRMGQPMYKVAIHPPGTTFPPNGLPVVTLYYRNDDGGPGFGKDSRLVFDPPADGEYQVRVGDARGQGGPLYAYRLTVRPPRPSFNVTFSPTAPAVRKGGAVPDHGQRRPHRRLRRADRGAAGEPAARLQRPGDDHSGRREQHELRPLRRADGDRAGRASPLKLTARAMIDGKDVVREAVGRRAEGGGTRRHRDDDGAVGGDGRAGRRGARDGEGGAAQRLRRPHPAGGARPAARRPRAGRRPQRHPHHGEGDDADLRDLRRAVGRADGASVRGAGEAGGQEHRARGEVGAAAG